MGHEVLICGDYEYCLGCGRETTTNHSTSAKRIFWRRQFCNVVIIIERYRKRKHDIMFDGWWA
eukprot:11184877-Heterocapsa_arctica.AAC.1